MIEAESAITADKIAIALAARHARLGDFFLTQVKSGPTGWGQLRILDAVAIAKSWMHECITGYEIKISRQDFLRDDKWHEYLPMCHQFYFAAPLGVLDLSELPQGVGFIEYKSNGQIKVHRKAVKNAVDQKAMTKMLQYIIYSRLEPDRHPFYTDQSRYAHDFLAAQRDDKERGGLLGQKIRELESQAEERVWEREQGRAASARLNDIRKIIHKKAGCISDDEMVEIIRKLAEEKPVTLVSPAIKRSIRLLVKEAEELCGMLGGKENEV